MRLSRSFFASEKHVSYVALVRWFAVARWPAPRLFDEAYSSLLELDAAIGTCWSSSSTKTCKETLNTFFRVLKGIRDEWSKALSDVDVRVQARQAGNPTQWY